MSDENKYYEHLELFHFAFRGIIEEADQVLAKYNLNRAHHRIIYFVARAKTISMADLIEILGVSRQALHRPLKQLTDQGFVLVEPKPDNRRSYLVSLSAKGRKLEKVVTGSQVRRFEKLEQSISETPIEGWKRTMRELCTDSSYPDLDRLLGRSTR